MYATTRARSTTAITTMPARNMPVNNDSQSFTTMANLLLHFRSLPERRQNIELMAVVF
jgi:hypothetical protein